MHFPVQRLHRSRKHLCHNRRRLLGLGPCVCVSCCHSLRGPTPSRSVANPPNVTPSRTTVGCCSHRTDWVSRACSPRHLILYTLHRRCDRGGLPHGHWHTMWGYVLWWHLGRTTLPPAAAPPVPSPGRRRHTTARAEETRDTAERQRLLASERREADWKCWGPYGASQRQEVRDGMAVAGS